jgi:hypothetical protein
VNDRVARWVAELDRTLGDASQLVARGRAARDADPARPLAFEALSTRVGEIAKRLVAADAERFDSAIWAQAARNRDFVVHHYDRVDRELLWNTVAVSFEDLRRELS